MIRGGFGGIESYWKMVWGLPSVVDEAYILWDLVSKFVVEDCFGLAVAGLSVAYLSKCRV